MISDRPIRDRAFMLSTRGSPSRMVLAIACCLSVSAFGCALLSRRYVGPSPAGMNGPLPNPLVVPVTNIDFAWNQIVDMVDDYFEIASEQQVREIGGVWMEGRIETHPLTGATFLEPLRRDSTPGFERWQSTLQSIRRRAFVSVIPLDRGFQVFIEVHKELEDVNQPEFSTIGRSSRRHDGSLVALERLKDEPGSVTLGWIPLGRDESLEQEMLRQLHARLFHAVQAP